MAIGPEGAAERLRAGLRAGRDVSEPGLLLDAASVVATAFTADGGTDVDAIRLAALLHERRYRALDEETRTPDGLAAVGLLTAADAVEGSRAEAEAAVADAWYAHAEALDAARGRGGPRSLLDAAIHAWTAASELTARTHPEWPGRRAALGLGLLLRFDEAESRADVDAAVAALRDAADARPGDDPERAGYLTNLVAALQARFEVTGSTADLDEAIAVGRGLVERHPSATLWSNLGLALRNRFEHSDDGPDLDASIEAARAAVRLAPDHDARLVRDEANLSVALQVRFERSGDMTDLDDAVAAATRAARPDIPVPPAVLVTLAAALQIRFERTGRAGDLERAIATWRTAIASTPDHDRVHGATRLSNLGTALCVRFERDGALADVDAAVDCAQRAAALLPPDHPQRGAVLGGLGRALQLRHERTGSDDDLGGAITAGTDAVRATPAGAPVLAGRLSKLGTSLWSRLLLTGTRHDADVAAGVARAAVETAGPEHPDRPMYLSNLGVVLRRRFELGGDPEDLAAAVTTAREAVARTPTDHVNRGSYQLNLGSALAARHRITGDPAAAREALDAFRAASASAVTPALTRARAARGRGRLAADLGDWDDAVAALADAVTGMQTFAWHGLARRDRIDLLAEFSGLAGDAAAVAVRAGDPARALGLLERARGVLLGQVAHARTDRTALEDVAPRLAERMTRIRELLDGTPTPGGWVGDGEPLRGSEQRRDLARTWDELVAEARLLPGLERFLDAPSAADLLAAASAGPVAVVLASEYGSVALIVTGAAAPLVVRLPEVTPTAVATHAGRLVEAVGRGSAVGRQEAAAIVTATAEWLWDVLAQPVLDALQLPPSARLWWCPTGRLAFLPLHAAGRHDRRDGRSSVLDRVISSYTPTVRALLEARTATRASGTTLAVAVADGSAQRLRHVEDEMRTVRRFDAGAVTLTGPRATRAAVLRALPECAIFHFAGHGEQDVRTADSGALFPVDHATAGPVTVADLAELHLRSARLAVLSACETGAGSLHLPDEAVDLAGALQAAGFVHVVATRWWILDRLTADLVERFYTLLASDAGGGPDPDRTATALHAAVRRARDSPVSTPLTWAPYVHIGP